MACLIHTEETDKTIKETEELLKQEGDDSKNYYNIAYFVVASNMGYSVDKTPNGEHSYLYEDLLNAYGNNATLAALAKSVIYTSEFIKYFGNWMETPEMEEPSFTDVMKFLNRNGKNDRETINSVDIEDELDILSSGNILMSSTAAQSLSERIDKECEDYVNDLFEHDDEVKQEVKSLVGEALSVLPLEEIDEEAIQSATVTVKRHISEQKKREFIREKVNGIFLDIVVMFDKYWGLSEFRNEDGTYRDVLSEDDLKNIDYSDFRVVQQYRINLVRFIQKSIYSKSHQDFKFLSTLLFDMFKGDIDEPLLAKNIINAYVEIHKNMPYMMDVYKRANLLKYDKNGSPTRESISHASNYISQKIKQEMEDFVTGGKLKHKFTNLYKTLKLLGRVCLSKLSNRAGSISIVSSIITAFISYYVTQDISTASTIGSSVGTVLFTIGKTAKSLIKIDMQSYNTIRQATKKLILASAYNGELNEGLESDSRYDLFLQLVAPYIASGNQRVLTKIYNILNKQLKSLTSVAQSDTLDVQKQQDIESIRRQIDDVLKSIQSVGKESENISSSLFLSNFINGYMYQQITNAKISLLIMRESGIVDVKELIRIKQDVVGAFNNINVNIFTYSNIIELKRNGIDIEDISNIEYVRRLLDETKQILNETIYKYCEDTIDQYLSDKKINSKYKQSDLSSLRKNIIDCLYDNCINGDINFVQQYVTSANNTNSPLISMLVQMFEDTETEVKQEYTDGAQKLKDLLQSKGIMFFNQFNKFVEKTKDGLFTDFLISPVKQGLYFQQKREFSKKILKKYGVIEDETGDDGNWDESYAGEKDMVLVYNHNGKEIRLEVSDNPNAPVGTITRWQAYKIEMALWEGGAELNGDVQYITDKSIARLNKRQSWIADIIKYKNLNKQDCDTLREIDQRIAQISKDCMEEVTVKGKTIKVPITSKLSPTKLRLYKYLVRAKNNLSSSYDIYVENDENISSINNIDNELILKRAERFTRYNEEKKQYLDLKQAELDKEGDELIAKIMNETDKENIKQIQKQLYDLYGDIELYKAVIKKFNSEISSLTDQINSTTDPDVKTTLIDKLNTLKNQKNQFVEENTTLGIDSKAYVYLIHVRQTKYGNSKEAVQYLQQLQAIRTLKSHLRILSKNKRILDLSNIHSDTVENTKQVWHDVIQLYKDLQTLGEKLTDVEQLDFSESSRVDASSLFTRELIPYLDENGEVSDKYDSFVDYLISEFGFKRSDLKIMVDGNLVYPDIFYYSEADSAAVGELLDPATGERVFENPNDIFTYNPYGIFSRGTYFLQNQDYEESEDETYQINRERKEYDNSDAYDKIKDDPLYAEMLNILDKIYENMPGITRRNRYQLPGIEASIEDMFQRAFINKRYFLSTLGKTFNRMFSWLHSFENRDFDNNQNYITRADGTVVNLIPTRGVGKLKDANMICTDLGYSLLNTYYESVRYKYRSKNQYKFQAFLFALSGGYSKAPGSPVSTQFDILESEMAKWIYGMGIKGSGRGGRFLPGEVGFAVLSKRIRGMLHTHLMGINLLSMAVNGCDSFLNTFAEGMSGRYYNIQSLMNGIGKMAQNILSFTSWNTPYATSFTQSLIQKNDLDKQDPERFKDLNKSGFRRGWDSTTEAMYEFIDYSSKAAITEAIYDNYRLIENPFTGYVEFMNHNQAIRVYEQAGKTQLDGHYAWKKARKRTLRSMYYFKRKNPKNPFSRGTVVLRDYIYYGGRKISPKNFVTPLLESEIKTQLRHEASYVNGMLDSLDKNSISRHYAGAMVTCYRGWMITQGGENLKHGNDMAQTIENSYNPSVLSKFVDKIRDLLLEKKGFVQNRDVDGKFNFTTNVPENGYLVNQFSTIARHFQTFILFTVIPPLMFTNKMTYQSNITADEMQRLKHSVVMLHYFLLAAAMLGLMCMSTFSNPPSDDDVIPYWIKLLTIATLTKTVTERFSTLCVLTFAINLGDILNAVTVANTLVDNCSCLLDVLDDIASLVEHDNRHNQIEKTGSFKGATKLTKDVGKATGVLGINMFNELLAADFATSFDWAPEWAKNTKFRDFNANWYKKTHDDGIQEGVKYYNKVAPMPFVNWVFDSIGIPTKQPKRKKVNYYNI